MCFFCAIIIPGDIWFVGAYLKLSTRRFFTARPRWRWSRQSWGRWGMRSRDFVFSSSPAELFAAHTKQTNAVGEPARRHAEADPPQLHRHPRLRPGTHGTVYHTRPLLPECLPRWLGKRGRSAETHHGKRGRWTPGRRVPQTGPDHLHSHVPTAFPVGAAYCVLHQLSTPELFLRLHAIWQITERGSDLLQVGQTPKDQFLGLIVFRETPFRGVLRMTPELLLLHILDKWSCCLC